MEELLKELNEAQREAVLFCDGPLLILAGAGSGKTRVLTHKVLHLIKSQGIDPKDILAVTFTNKAANEMKDRIYRLLKIPTWDLWISTFHAACMRILRVHAEKLGYTKNFVIYDDTDQKRLLKKIILDLDIDSEQFELKKVKNRINRAKNNLISAEAMQGNALSLFERQVASVYLHYQETLNKNDAMDFGDILMNVVTLFNKHPEVLKYYQDKFKYILVDEYQDTNRTQYVLLKLLAEKRKNICVVGDDDQSIYKFRGANIENILNFEKDYKNAKVVKLEQNYRSTKNIINAAHSVISHNSGRKDKKLFTQNIEGEKIRCFNAQSETAEANFVIREIKRFNDKPDFSFKDIAIFFRTNAQSRIFEEEFFKEGIPYVFVGGLKFYSRAEIKDIIAYLKIVSGANDIVSFRRAINRPRRGIGDVTVKKVEKYMEERGIDFFSALKDVNSIDDLNAGTKKKLEGFVVLIEEIREDVKDLSTGDLITRIYNATGYKSMLERDPGEEARDREKNIDELINGAYNFEESAPDADLSMYLDFVSLVNDTDSYDENNNRVTLITLHSAKGLEFPIVFMTGMEEGIFPHANSMHDKAELEEERRLCYVGITRAKERLIMTHSSSRRTYGAPPSFQRPSRFIDDIPDELITGKNMKAAFAVSGFKKKEWPKRRETRKFRFAEDPSGQDYQKSIVNTYFNDVPPASEYQVGKLYMHPVFGKGKLKRIEGAAGAQKLTIYFPKAGDKKIMAKFVQLKEC